jgi:2-polyprenyl-3-methyl-5-hydroxy-6-metoxy-1,4-benzoquinol methylase
MKLAQKELVKSIEAAKLEFVQEPMDDYYDNKLVGFFSRWRVKKLIALLGDVRQAMVLEAGCEAGYVSLQLNSKRAKIFAFDILYEPLEKFKKKLNRDQSKSIRLFTAAGQFLPVKPETFDIVVATEVIEHMPKVELFFKESYRVLKPGGRLIVSFPNEQLREKLYPVVKFLGVDTTVEKDVTLFAYDFENICRLLAKYYRIEHKSALSPLWPMTYFILARKIK